MRDFPHEKLSFIAEQTVPVVQSEEKKTASVSRSRAMTQE